MLSYLHSFHAGNHADILKHVTLLYVLEYMNKKEKPYSFFDTHAGRGLYNLKSAESEKTGEAENGICKLLKIAESDEKRIPEQLFPYLNFVKPFLKNNFYPGSPVFEVSFSKKNSFVSLNELHKTEFSELQKNINFINPDCGVGIQNVSGWETLRKNIPPKINRGAILCDPSYEEKSDFTNAAEFLSFAHKKWSAATILLWYPLLQNKIEEIENMKQAIYAAAKNKDVHTEILDAKLFVDSEQSHQETSLENSIGSTRPRLYGSGMFVVRPSWGLKEHLESVLPFLTEVLSRENNVKSEVDLF